MISGTSAGVPVGLEQVEVEGLPQALRAGVAGASVSVHPGLGDGGARWVVFVEHLAPLAVDLVHLVAIPERVVAVAATARRGQPSARQRLGEVLGQTVGHVDPEAVDAAVGPEPQRRAGSPARTSSVVPVQVGLLGGEQVQVPLAVGTCSHAGPPNNDAQSRRRFARRPARAVAEDVSLTGRRTRGAASASLNQTCRFEVWLGTMSTISLMPASCSAARHPVEVRQRPELGVDVAVVVDVVAAVGQRRGIERAEPHGVDAQVGQVADRAR